MSDDAIIFIFYFKPFQELFGRGAGCLSVSLKKVEKLDTSIFEHSLYVINTIIL